MNKKLKCCENCKFYARHYAQFNYRLIKVYCGHCTFDFKRSKKQPLPSSVCENWKKDDRPKLYKRALKETIENISKRLDEFSTFLKIDK